MREVIRRRWRVALDVGLGLFLAFVVVSDTWRNPVRWELVCGLTVVVVSVATGRRYPLFSLGVAMAGSLAVPFPYGDRVPVWVVFVLVAMSYLAGLRVRSASRVLLLAGAVALLGIPLALLVGPDGMGDWGAMAAILVFGSVSPWLLGRYAQVTPREREVLSLLGSGLSNADIAARIFVVEGTVKAHVSTILSRLGAKNRVQAAITAYEAGLAGGDSAAASH